MTLYAGLDVSDKSSRVCVVDAQGIDPRSPWRR